MPFYIEGEPVGTIWVEAVDATTRLQTVFLRMAELVRRWLDSTLT